MSSTVVPLYDHVLNLTSLHDSCAHYDIIEEAVSACRSSHLADVHGETAPPKYQEIDPLLQSSSNIPSRPARTPEVGALDDIYAIYSDYVEDDQTWAFMETQRVSRPSLLITMIDGAEATAVKPVAFSSPVNAHFEALRRDPLNLILDSINSSRAPHIVITPPPYQWYDFHAPAENAVPPQRHGHLTVPGAGRPSLPRTLPVPASPSRPLPPSPTISPRRINRDVVPSNRIVRKKMDQLGCYHTYRACALLTARRASYALRSPSAHLISLMETDTFTWTDPAESLLSWMRQFRGITILDSMTPCTVPHIVIAEPPEAEPWVAWGNVAPEQDPAEGELLSLVYYPRPTSDFEDDDSDTLYSSDEEDGVSEFFYDLDFFDDAESLASPTRTETPAPVTPPAYAVAAWRELSGKEHNEEANSLSPISGPRLPMLLVQGDESWSSHDFPSSIEHDGIFSPVFSPEGVLVVSAGSPEVTRSFDWSRARAMF